MSDLTKRLRHAQKVRDRCGGDLAEAMTYAAFRLPVRRVLDETWPTPEREGEEHKGQGS